MYISLPGDNQEVATNAYAGAMHIVLNTYPDVHRDTKTIAAVARANFDVFVQEVETNNLAVLAESFCSAFGLGYVESFDYYTDKPEVYKELLSLTEDEQISALKAMAFGWYKALPIHLGKIQAAKKAKRYFKVKKKALSQQRKKGR